MSDEVHEFNDYYALLQVSPTCDAKMLEKAYRYFAQMYHPDHTQTADIEKFQEIIEAYRVLRDPASRADYDQEYRLHHKVEFFEQSSDGNFHVDGKTAMDDADAHEKILQFLYKRRREKPRDPGVIGFYIQELLQCSDETFDFHSWYLRSKGLMRATEHGTLEITIEGVEHVISVSREAERRRLISDQSSFQPASASPPPDEDQ